MLTEMVYSIVLHVIFGVDIQSLVLPKKGFPPLCIPKQPTPIQDRWGEQHNKPQKKEEANANNGSSTERG